MASSASATRDWELQFPGVEEDWGVGRAKAHILAVTGLIGDEFSDGFVGDPHVGAKFLYGEELVFGFVEGGLDFQDGKWSTFLTVCKYSFFN
ncbi:hypothetical protein [Chryseobacterium koreense]|uniref:Uncharacterized protein n=1 Tax=Chryseobacterium koreense CCUG 49689 TaxID=1304281 RepID=A0A0J7IYZ7_9FLAO|nr:hypothetical protein [Chryseobacterium koreense]KMQ71024.1 hypothetical protein ACM44_08720 [Chryseobacterium koreense CCUG 49689]MBB5334719.1 hypothetical protein [Chryseobacterium koreense]